MARERSLGIAKDELERLGLVRELGFLAAYEALLEVLPVSRAFSGFDPARGTEEAAGDFEALENLRRLALEDRVAKPKQLDLFEQAA